MTRYQNGRGLLCAALLLCFAASGAPRALAQVDGGATPPSDPAVDAELLKELEAATAPLTPPTPAAPAAPARGSAASAFSNLYNPALSVNGLFLGALTGPSGAEGDDAGDEEEEELSTGVGIQEVEIQFVSNVDPYFGANIIAAMEGGEGIGIEEGYVTVTPQPANLAFRFGKMKVPFGRENTLHTHALPFVGKSLAGEALLGEEGLAEVGLEASYLIPLPFYSLVTVSALNGDNELLFGSPRGEDLAYLANLKSLFDLGEDATLELGLSYVAGRNVDERLTQAGEGHLIFKWRPARRATTRSAVAMVEALYTHKDAAGGAVDDGGAYAYLQWQLARRWFAAGRFDWLGLTSDAAEAVKRESLILTLAPTEFSAVRLEGDVTEDPAEEAVSYAALLQFNFTLGAHPAHAY